MEKYSPVAVIGLGEIGGILAAGIMERCGIPEDKVYLFDRHPEKRAALAVRFPKAHYTETQQDALRSARCVILCVQPERLPEILPVIQRETATETNLFISTSNISVTSAEELSGRKVSKFLPTVNSAIGRGVIFAAHGERVTASERIFFRELMGKFCRRYYEIPECDFALLNNLAGCAPAFLACFCQCLCRMACSMQTSLRPEQLEELFCETFTAAGAWMEAEGLNFRDVAGRIGKPGGITCTAMAELEKGLPDTVSAMLCASVRRHEEIDKNIDSFMHGL